MVVDGVALLILVVVKLWMEERACSSKGDGDIVVADLV